jgi:CheY-like chemotaxis protein
MFEALTQAHRSSHHVSEGLGLGLALVRGLVELHGGKVWGQSEGPGRGTEISIRLPLEAGPPAPLPPAVLPASAATSRRVLVIEDDVDSAECMRTELEFLGHQVRVAHNGLQGVETAQAFHPEVVLCDVGLPGGMDGYAVARALRSQLALRSAYLVAVTGYGQEADRLQALQAGFDLHLTKPIDLSALEQLVTHPPLQAVPET